MPVQVYVTEDMSPSRRHCHVDPSAECKALPLCLQSLKRRKVPACIKSGGLKGASSYAAYDMRSGNGNLMMPRANADAPVP